MSCTTNASQFQYGDCTQVTPPELALTGNPYFWAIVIVGILLISLGVYLRSRSASREDRNES